MRYYVTPLRSPRPHDVTCRCNSIGRWYVTYDVTFFSASPYPTERLDVILLVIGTLHMTSRFSLLASILPRD
jgi:hypothetical protein